MDKRPGDYLDCGCAHCGEHDAIKVAAPEMLEALQEIVRELESMGFQSAFCQRARAIIHKATGEGD